MRAVFPLAGWLFAFAIALSLSWSQTGALAAPMDRDTLSDQILPPFHLGDAVNDKGVWSLENSGGIPAGYVFETEPLAPLPGFSGAPVNVLVMLDLEGRFLDVRLISHNEPIFVSGLGHAAFAQFFTQYRGHSLSTPLVVGTAYGAGADGSGLVYLDGVTKATASVRIAHESILAAALQVAREKMKGVSSGPPVRPDPAVQEDLTWDDLIAQGLVGHLHVSNGQMDDAFAGTLWADDDPEARTNPEATFLDLWVVDLGPPAIARAVLDEGSVEELEQFLEISTDAAPILVIDAGRHGLVTETFVRNTAPDLLSAAQFDLPVALRDSDLFFDLHPDLPEALHDAVADGAGLILRTDKRLGFDPTQPWTMQVRALRAHGSFQPEIGSVTLETTLATDDRFYLRPAVGPTRLSPVQEALRARALDLAVLAVALGALFAAMGPGMRRLAAVRQFTAIRLGILAAMTVFVGWWGQGQLSIVTVTGVLRAALEGGSLTFLLYDPFSLLVWGAAILGFVLWGRALFCGWLCPFGALQEFAHHIGRWLRLPQIQPSRAWDQRLKLVKYGVLAVLLGLTVTAPQTLDRAAEVEPFKTAITTGFQRAWYYVAYALGMIGLSAVLFKGFCRYVCPLGAVMALGGLVRQRAWIARRVECGSPCQLCSVRCNYQAISKTGAIQYDECFGCLDCVKIHDDRSQCVPLILAARRTRRAEAA